MNKKQMITYIAALCNLQLDEMILFKFAEKTSKFDLIYFANFIENNLDHVDLKYKNSLDRFITFCKLYEQELRMQKEQEIKNDVQKLADKFSKIKIVMHNELKQGRKPLPDEIKDARTKQNYFSDFEISILNRIGDLKYLITLANLHQLEDKISNSLLLSLMPAQNNALPFAANAIKRF